MPAQNSYSATAMTYVGPDYNGHIYYIARASGGAAFEFGYIGVETADTSVIAREIWMK